MAKLSAAEQYAKWLNQHPNATQKKLEKWLRGHGEVAYYLGQQEPATTAAATPTPGTADPTATSSGAATGSSSGAADPTPLPDPTPPPPPTDDRTVAQKIWDWLRNNPIAITYPVEGPNVTAWLNVSIWAAALGVLGWLLLRKKKI